MVDSMVVQKSKYGVQFLPEIERVNNKKLIHSNRCLQFKTEKMSSIPVRYNHGSFYALLILWEYVFLTVG